jgi:hypothetical protein
MPSQCIAWLLDCRYSMNFRKVLVLLLGCCLSLAPVFGYAADDLHLSARQPSATQSSVAHTDTAHIPAHVIDCPTTHLAAHPLSDAGADLTGDPAIHSCCFHFVGILSPSIRIQPLSVPVAPIAFHLSPHPASWSDGPYRPPRQIS